MRQFFGVTDKTMDVTDQPEIKEDLKGASRAIFRFRLLFVFHSSLIDLLLPLLKQCIN